VAETLVTLEIDGQAVTVPAGTSVMRAAVEAGVQVPSCAPTDQHGIVRLLPPVPGGGRGPPRNSASCTTLAEPGDEGENPIPQTCETSAGVMELYISTILWIA